MPRYNSMEYGNLDFPILPNKILPTNIKLSFRKYIVCTQSTQSTQSTLVVPYVWIFFNFGPTEILFIILNNFRNFSNTLHNIF